MLTLWGRLTSVNVQRVAWVLAETGLEYARIDTGGAFGGLDDQEYLAMNPNRRVPTLKDGSLVLWESNAICRYLVDAYRGPLATAHKARADMWMEWFQNGPYAPFIEMFYQTVRLPAAQRDAAVLQQALDRLHGHFDIAEAALAKSAYLTGDTLSLADVPFGTCLYRYFTCDFARGDYPNIKAYYDRLTSRAAYRDTVVVDYSSLRPPG